MFECFGTELTELTVMQQNMHEDTDFKIMHIASEI